MCPGCGKAFGSQKSMLSHWGAAHVKVQKRQELLEKVKLLESSSALTPPPPPSPPSPASPQLAQAYVPPQPTSPDIGAVVVQALLARLLEGKKSESDLLDTEIKKAYATFVQKIAGMPITILGGSEKAIQDAVRAVLREELKDLLRELVRRGKGGEEEAGSQAPSV